MIRIRPAAVVTLHDFLPCRTSLPIGTQAAFDPPPMIRLIRARDVDFDGRRVRASCNREPCGSRDGQGIDGVGDDDMTDCEIIARHRVGDAIARVTSDTTVTPDARIGLLEANRLTFCPERSTC